MPAIPQLSFTAWLSLILWVGPVVAQPQPVDLETASIDPVAALETGDESEDGSGDGSSSDDVDDDLVTRLVLESPPPAGAWLEVASLIADVPAYVEVFEGGAAERDALVPEPIDPGLPQGPAMVCSGVRPQPSRTLPTVDASETETPVSNGEAEAPAPEPPVDAGIFCQRAFLYRGEASFGPPGDEDLVVPIEYADREASPGTPLTGWYRLGVEPIDGARVALVPLDLHAEQGFVMPLGLSADGPRLVHSVTTDADGRFRMPPVQAGRYRLEALLPSGRIHRSDAVDLPDLTTLRNDVGPDPPPDLAFDLGSIDVAAGLGLEVLAVDDLGLPIEAARVVARQGETPASLTTYASRTDADGRAELSGFDVERPVLLGCSAPGHVPERAEHELIPVSWTCTLARLARVIGVVVGPTDTLPEGVVVTLHAIETEAPIAPISVPIGADGAFVAELAPGAWELVATASGMVPQRLNVLVGAGDRDDLGLIPLLPGRDLLVTVVDGATRQPVVGASVRSVDPPGAADTVTDADGETRVVVPTDRPMHLAVTAEADGYAAGRLRLDPGEREPRTVELHRGGWIRIVGCPGCRLRVVPGHHVLTTDGDGDALSLALAPRWYDVVRPRFEHLGSTVVETPDAERRRIRVRAGEVATVRFDAPASGLTIRPDRRLEGTWRLEARTPWSAIRSQPQADGSWALGLDPTASRRAQWLSIHGWDATANAEIRVYQGTLPAGFVEETFTLPIGTGQVRGRLQTGGIGFSGEPAAGVRVQLLRFEDGFPVAEVRSDPEGRFHVPHLHTGTYALHLGDRTVQFLSVGRGQTIDAGTFQLFSP